MIEYYKCHRPYGSPALAGYKTCAGEERFVVCGLTTDFNFMAKTRQQKEQNVSDLTKRLQNMKAAVIVDYKGLNVKAAQSIRSELWGQPIVYQVVKKRLFDIALINAGLSQALDVKNLKGNIGVVVGAEDEVSTAKFAAKFAKEYETFKILGGLFDGCYVNEDKIKMLAALPSKVELLAKVVGCLQAPISGFVNVLAGNLRGLVRVLNAIQEQRAR